MKSDKLPATLILGAVSSLLTLTATPASGADIKCAEQERCYGVVKAGKNDCATSTSACLGSAKQDSQKDAWLLVPKGTCAKLTGGSLTPPASPKKK
jgi:uncharacterized membrane protein